MLKNNDISIPEACYADLCKVGFFERKQVKLKCLQLKSIKLQKNEEMAICRDGMGICC